MTRAPVLALGALLVALVLPSAAQARGCATLKGPSDTTGAIKLVGRRVCTKPDGPVRVLKLSPARPRTAGAQLTFVHGRTAYRFDVSTGRLTPLRYLGRNPTGAILPFDSGEVAARVPGRGLVVWTRDGRAVRVAAPAVPVRKAYRVNGIDVRTAGLTCGRLPGRALSSPVATTHVSSLQFRSEYLAGEISGITTRVLACSTRGGPVQVLGQGIRSTGSVGGGEVVTPFAFGPSSVVALERISDSQEEYTPSTLTRFDLLAGTSTKIWGNADAKGPGAGIGTQPIIGVVAPNGTLVASFDAATGVTVGAFPAGGAPRRLDGSDAEGQVDGMSLALGGSVVSWRHGTATRSFDTSAP